MTQQYKQTEKELACLTEQAIRPGRESDTLVAGALQSHSRTALPTIFNRRERKVVQDALIAELAQGFEHRRKAVSMALESRLHSIREACNHVLVMGKAHLREQRMEYYGEVMCRLEKRMHCLAESFLQDVDRRFNSLDQYHSAIIRKREHERLEKSVEQFLSTLDRMMEEFNSIIGEHVDHNIDSD